MVFFKLIYAYVNIQTTYTFFHFTIILRTEITALDDPQYVILSISVTFLFHSEFFLRIHFSDALNLSYCHSKAPTFN
jgi:hypothetical protein